MKNKIFNIVAPYMLSSLLSFYAFINSNTDVNNEKYVDNIVSENSLEYDADINTVHDNELSNEIFERSIESVIKNYTVYDIGRLVNTYSFINNGKFGDNIHYKILRKLDAEKQIMKYQPDSDNVIIIDKTFQKGLIFKKSIIDKAINKDTYRFIENKDTYRFIEEFDCTTGKIYGKKQREGDGKTPEGMFNIQSVRKSHNNLFDGKKAYGPYFMRIYHSIGIHGNGTDTTHVKNWAIDKAYMAPDPLGITRKNNFGYGISHACIRFENSVIREKVDDGTMREGTQVIIYENKKLTTLLQDAYNNYNKYVDEYTIYKLLFPGTGF